VKLPTTAIASERELLGLIELGKRDASMVRSQIRELQYVEKAFAEAKKVARVSSTSTQRQLVMRLQGKRDSAKRDVTRGVILLEGRAAGIKKAKNELVAYKNSISKTTNSRQVASLTATIKAASMMFATLVTIAKIARTVITSSNSAGVRYPQVAPTPTNPVNTAAKLANTFAVRR
jgi:hypothetical protein